MFPILPPRMFLLAMAGAALLAALGGYTWKVQHDQRERDKAAVEASQAQARVSDVTAKAVDTFHTETIVIRERADRAVQAVERAPGAETPIDPDLLRVWRDGLRNIETGASGGDNPAKPSGAVQTP